MEWASNERHPFGSGAGIHEAKLLMRYFVGNWIAKVLRWEIFPPAQKPQGWPFEAVTTSTVEAKLADVWVGDVSVRLGQSNMECKSAESDSGNST